MPEELQRTPQRGSGVSHVLLGQDVETGEESSAYPVLRISKELRIPCIPAVPLQLSTITPTS